jgi:hypothetical protein
MLWTAPATGIEVPKLRLLLRNRQKGSRPQHQTQTLGGVRSAAASSLNLN